MKTKRFCILYKGEDVCDWEDNINRMIWCAEEYVSNNMNIDNELDFKRMVCEFIAKLNPFQFGVILNHYIDIYPSYDNELKNIYL